MHKVRDYVYNKLVTIKSKSNTTTVIYVIKYIKTYVINV